MDSEILILVLLLFSAYILIFTVIKWFKVLRIRKEINDGKLISFKELKLTSFSYNGEGIKGKSSIGMFPLKSEIIFTKNELFFLPLKFSFLLGMSEIPRSFNKNFDSNSNKRILKKELMIKFENKEIKFKRKIIEITLTGNQFKVDEFENYLNDWLKK